MALPTVESTSAGSAEFIRAVMAPALAPLQAAASVIGNPLQSLNAPPIVMAGMSAASTMFGGGGGGGTGGGGGSTTTPGPLASGFSGGPEPTVLLESIVENTFHLEDMMNTLDQINTSVLELVEKIVGQRRHAKGAVNEDGKKMGGKFIKGKREKVEKVDQGAKLKAIEARREAERAKKKGGGKGGGGVGETGEGLGGLTGFGKSIASMGKGIGKAISGFMGGIARGIMAFANPLVLAGLAVLSASLPIAALGITAMMKVFEHFGTSFEPLKKFIEALEPLFKFIGDLIGTVIESLGKAIGSILKPLAEQLHILIPLFDTFMGTLLGFWESLERVLVVLMDSVVEVVTLLAPTLEKIADLLLTIMPPLIPIIADVVTAVREAIAGIVEIFHTIERTISTVLDKVKTGVVDIVTAIGTQVTGIFGSIKDLVVEVIDSTVAGIERLAALDGAALLGVGAGIASIGAGLALLGGGKVAGAVGGLVEGVAGWISGKGDTVEQLMKYAEIGPEIEKAGAAIFGIGKGLSLMGEANLDKLGDQLVQIKGPMEELSKIDISGPQAQIFAAMKESQLQASERTASAESGGATVVNAASNSTQNNYESTQMMIAAQQAIIKGQGNIEGAGLNLT